MAEATGTDGATVAHEATERWDLGRVWVTSVVESQTDGIPPALFFPAADEGLVRRHAWLPPGTGDDRGRLGLRVQAFVIETGDLTILVDPCVGNGRTRSLPFWNDQAWPFMERFRAAGFDPDAVDLVVHTHLHVDHVGWATRPDGDGRWVPTFPRARYLYVGDEVEAQAADHRDDAAAMRADSIEPIFAAGQAETVPADADLGAELRLAPTVGHTPGHASLWLDGGERPVLITGDALHHPVQCAEPDIDFVSDADPATARATRRRLLAEAVDAGAVVFGTHFPTSPAGTVAPAPDGEAGWRFTPVPGRT
jgi:glyoxylase-like metal-dependent hydrolase (beta-lactamase superfamily II)